MTIQSKEILIYNGVETDLANEPFNQYLITRPDIEITWPSTACWRGYYGTWEIKDDQLYLINLEFYLKDYSIVGVEYFFPGNERVFADWFTGELQIMTGYEDDLDTNKDLVLLIDAGYIVGSKLVEPYIDF